MTPKRGDRVTVPPPADEWDVIFGTSEAVKGWEELCRLALPNVRRCLAALRTTPASREHPGRQHRLRGDLSTHRHNGEDLEQWEYEVTSGGRVRYLVDHHRHRVLVVYASPRHPRDTDARR